MGVGQKIRLLRKEKDLTLKDVAQRANISISYLNDIEKERSNPSLDTLKQIAKALDVKPSYLLEDAETILTDSFILKEQPAVYGVNRGIITLPVVGTVAAGIPILAEENIEEYMDFPKDLADGATFALRVRGDSMIGVGIYDGDYVVVKQQPTAENGQTVVARVEGAVTIKRFYRLDNKIRLEPANGGYKPIESKDIEIIGVVMAIARKFF